MSCQPRDRKRVQVLSRFFSTLTLSHMGRD